MLKRTSERRARPANPRAWLVGAVFAIGLGFSAALARADEVGSIENKVKAAFIYKFAQYVEWPEGVFTQASTPIVIGTIGSAAITSELERMTRGLTANERPIEVRSLKYGDPLRDIHILFVDQSQDAHVYSLLDSIKTRPVLTISESSNAFAAGSIINFLLADQRVQFEISLPSAESKGIKLSSRLLSVAKHVQSRKP